MEVGCIFWSQELRNSFKGEEVGTTDSTESSSRARGGVKPEGGAASCREYPSEPCTCFHMES